MVTEHRCTTKNRISALIGINDDDLERPWRAVSCVNRACFVENFLDKQNILYINITSQMTVCLYRVEIGTNYKSPGMDNYRFRSATWN